jgi:hypothetical protein
METMARERKARQLAQLIKKIEKQEGIRWM